MLLDMEWDFWFVDVIGPLASSSCMLYVICTVHLVWSVRVLSVWLYYVRLLSLHEWLVVEPSYVNVILSMCVCVCVCVCVCEGDYEYVSVRRGEKTRERRGVGENIYNTILVRFVCFVCFFFVKVAMV